MIGGFKVAVSADFLANVEHEIHYSRAQFIVTTSTWGGFSAVADKEEAQQAAEVANAA